MEQAQARTPSSRHVVRTLPSYFPFVTGPANQARAVSCGLLDYGISTTILTTDFHAEAAPQSEVMDGVSIVRLPVRFGFMQYHVPQGAWKELLRIHADVFHIHSYRNFLGDVTSLVARFRKVPTILHLHGTLQGYRHIARPERHWMYNMYDKMTSPLPVLRSTRIIVSTREEMNEVDAYGIDRSRVSIIPMGVDSEKYLFRDLARNPTRITFVGRLTEDRNVEQLIYALGMLGDLTWSCHIVGGEERRSYATHLGYTSHLQQLAHNLGIADRVFFTGPIYGEVLRRTYAESGIFVYPSLYENFGQTILEAAAAGCALVTTRVGVAWDIIQDGVSGFFIERDEPQQLAQHLRWLLEHPEEQANMGYTAHSLVQRDFAWPPILQRYAALYNELIQEQADC